MNNFKPTDAETGQFHDSKVNTMAADAMGLCFTRVSAAMLSTMHDK